MDWRRGLHLMVVLVGVLSHAPLFGLVPALPQDTKKKRHSAHSRKRDLPVRQPIFLRASAFVLFYLFGNMASLILIRGFQFHMVPDASGKEMPKLMEN